MRSQEEQKQGAAGTARHGCPFIYECGPADIVRGLHLAKNFTRVSSLEHAWSLEKD